MARNPILTAVPIVCNLITLVLLAMVIFSGFNGGLRSIFWFRINSGTLSIPAPLSKSEYLSALSTVTGIDYVGQDVNAANLGLPDVLTTHLLTGCAAYADGHVECDKPAFGVRIDPEEKFQLAAAEDFISDKLDTALRHYSKASRWIASAYVASAVASLLMPVEAFFSTGFASFSAGLTTLILLAGSITGTAVFKTLVDAFNADISEYGITAEMGVIPPVFGFAGVVLTLVATVLYLAAYRREQRGSGLRGFDDKLPGGGVSLMHPGLTGGPVGAHDGMYDSAATRSKGGLFNKVGGSDARYVQIEEQHLGTTPGDAGDLGARGQTGRYADGPGSPDSIRPSRLDEDWGAPDEYAGAAGVAKPGAGAKTSAGPGASIPLMSLGGNKQTKDLNTAYEPYSDPR